MADSKNIAKLDAKLMESKLVDDSIAQDYKKVHSFLNTHVRKNGKILTEETFQKGDSELRQWLMVLYKKGASQEKLTSYLRIGLAHLCYDFVESTYSRIETDDLVTRALQSFKNRKFHKTFFKVATNEAATSKRGKKELKAKKKEASKKLAKSKKVTKVTKSAKTAQKKLSPKKKVTGKKPIPKKKKAVKKEEKKGLFSFFKF